MKNRAVRNTAGILVLLMIIIVLFSSFFLAAESGHKCEEDDCPVCAMLEICSNLLRSQAVGGLVVLLLVWGKMAAENLPVFRLTEKKATLVALKVRMDD